MTKFKSLPSAVAISLIISLSLSPHAARAEKLEHKELEYFEQHCPVPRQGGNKEYHSQFYEDYILSLVFSNVGKGTYVDVGANSPSYDSVTKHFYDKGWSGINIEPIKELYLQYKTERPRDINVNIGVSNKEGALDFYVLSSDLMSTGDKDFAVSAEAKGYTSTKNSMKVTTLNNILENHSLDEITFLKIDVEGMEKEVLEGVDLSKFKPKLIIIESIRPFSHKPTHEDWEHMLLKQGYLFMYFDSINRYYLHKSHYEEFKGNFAHAIKCNQLANEKYPEYKIENIFKHELDEGHPALEK